MPVKITWSNNTSDAAYVNEIWRKVKGSNDPYEYLDQVAITETEFTDSTAVDGTTYTYRVAIFNSTNGNRTWSDEYEEYMSAERARTLLANESDGLAIAFVDDTMMVKTNDAETFTSVLDGGVVYAGTSAKIVRQADNTLKYAPHNRLAETQQEVPWASVGLSSQVQTGEVAAIRENSASSNHEFSIYPAGGIANPIPQNYRLSFEALPQGRSTALILTQTAGFGQIHVDLENNLVAPSGGASGSVTDVGGGWKRVDLYLTNDSDINSLRIRVLMTAVYQGPTTYQGDGVSGMDIRRPQSQYMPASDGFIHNPNTQGANVVAFALPIDHDINGNSLGVLNEPQATNYITLSDGLDDLTGTWVRGELASVNRVAGVDGTPDTAWRIIPGTNSSGNHRLYQSFTSIDGTGCMSVLAKSGGYDFLVWQYEAASGYVEFNLSDGSIVLSGGNYTAKTTDMGNGWWLCEAYCTATAIAQQGRFYVYNATGAPAYPGDGTSGIDLQWPQFEEGQVATSPIITAGSQVTRVADRYTYRADGNSWFPAADVTVPATAYIFASEISPGAANRTIYQNSDGAAGFVSRYVRAPDADASVNRDVNIWSGGAQFYTAGNADGTPDKYAVTYEDAVGLNNCRGGGVVNKTAAVNAKMSRSHTLEITGAGTSWHGHVKELTWVPRTFTDLELQTLTTP